MEPLNSGSYPFEMVNVTGERLPKFSREESLMVNGSFDFIGLNYYTANYAANAPCRSGNQTFFTDACVILTSKSVRHNRLSVFFDFILIFLMFLTTFVYLISLICCFSNERWCSDWSQGKCTLGIT